MTERTNNHGWTSLPSLLSKLVEEEAEIAFRRKMARSSVNHSQDEDLKEMMEEAPFSQSELSESTAEV